MLELFRLNLIKPNSCLIIKSIKLVATLFFLSNTTLLHASINDVLEQANTLYSQKQFKAASKKFKHATALDKGSLSAWRGLGWSYWGLGKKERAYKIWTGVIKGFPNDKATLLTLAKANEQDQRLNDAIKYYSQVLELYPNELSAHKGKARVFIVQKKFKQAEKESRVVLSQKASDQYSQSLLVDSLMGQGRYKEAEKTLKELAKTKLAANDLYRLSMVLAEQGKYEEAASYYKASLDNNVDEWTLAAWRRLGTNLRKEGQKQRAYRLWQDLLESFPNDVPTLLALGRASHQDQLLQQSLDYYEQVVDIDPVNQMAYLSRAKIFFSQADFEAAEKEVKWVLRYSPYNEKAKLVLVDILIATNRSKEAEQIIRPLVDDADEQEVKYLTRLAKVLSSENRNEEAAGYLEKSLKSDPENIKAVQALARVMWNQHRFDEGEKLLQDYLTLHPENDFVRARLTEHATAAANWGLAEKEFQILIDKNPSDNKWKIKYARQLDMAGKHEQVIRIAKQVVVKEPNNEAALRLLADNAIFSGDIASGIHWTKKIIKLKPDSVKFNQLGKLHIKRGAELGGGNINEAAKAQFFSAEKAFQHAANLDPIKSRAPIGRVEALRLQRKYPEAIQLASQLHKKYPNSVDIIQQLVNIHQDLGDYPKMLKWIKQKQAFFPDDIKLQQSLAKYTFYSGEQKKGLKMMKKLQGTTDFQSVQALLYHGVTASERQDTVSVKIFRDQMLALKKAGYHTITMDQLHGFLVDKASLPAKPLLITFDDARTDSIRNADPILAEMGFQATMFVPVADVATHGAYTTVWSTLKETSKNGRWDLQCHGTEAQHYIPVNKKGYQGRFMANKKWLVDENRQETAEEFSSRIDQDLKDCKEAIEREVPDSNVYSFAFPYSDQGHRSLSNSPDIFSLNDKSVKKQFQMAFYVANDSTITRDISKHALPRFEVPRTLMGNELVKQLKSINPSVSIPYELARLKMDAGNYAQAIQIYDKLESEGGIDKAELMAKTGKALSWSGDHVGARDQLEKARILRPGDPGIRKDIAALDHRLRHVVKFDGLYFEDNAGRSYYSLGPSVEMPISDNVAISAYYKYLDFDQAFTVHNNGALAGQQNYQAYGHQFEAQLNYEFGARSLLSLSAGMADFSGHSFPAPSKSDATFPLGSIKLITGVGERLDLFISADHTYVNTAGAILNKLAFSRTRGGFKFKILDSLNLKANYAYSYYTDDNLRSRAEVDLDSRVWNNPDITIGAQFIYDNIQDENELFWTPNNYVSYAVPLNIRKKWGADFMTELNVTPGMGKEQGSQYKFQINSTGTVKWNYKDDINLYLSAGRYEASTYSNFSAFAGGSLRF